MASKKDDRPPAARLLGRSVVSVDLQAKVLGLTFEAAEDFTNRHGTIQGGLLAAMLDSAAGNAVLATLPPDMTAVTTRLDTRFHAPATVGTLSATARVVASTDQSAEVDTTLVDGAGNVIASARAEMRLLRKARSNDA